jgi:hypothetical protein
MMSFSSLTADTVLLAAYIFSGSILNIIALFISTFYQHSLNQKSPQIGFIGAILFAFIFIFIIIFGSPHSAVSGILALLSLVGYGVTSTISIMVLFFKMRSIRR